MFDIASSFRIRVLLPLLPNPFKLEHFKPLCTKQAYRSQYFCPQRRYPKVVVNDPLIDGLRRMLFGVRGFRSVDTGQLCWLFLPQPNRAC